MLGGSLLSCDDEGCMVVAVESNLLRLQASIANHKVEMLLDSGASHNFMSVEFASLLAVPVEVAPVVSVRLADGS